MKFLIDEDLPRSLSKILEDQGFEVLDVRDCGLRGENDEAIFRFAQDAQAILFSGDVGFGNLLRFPVGSHFGIVIVHFPNEISSIKLNNHILNALKTLSEDDLKENLIILEPGRLRMRRKRVI
ncbi:MAG: DUF5615 family PIN-like protein [bacterium]